MVLQAVAALAVGPRDPGAICPVAVEIAIVYQLHDDRPFLRDCLPEADERFAPGADHTTNQSPIFPKEHGTGRTFPRLTGGD